MRTDQFLTFSYALPEPMFMLSCKGEVLAVNPEASEMLGITTQTLVGQHLKQLVTEADDKITRYLRNWSTSNNLIPGSLQWRHNDGRVIDCSCEGAIVASQVDVSDRFILLRCKKKQEADSRFSLLNNELESLRAEHHKLMDQKDRLEEYVAERTVDIARHANELERVNAELDQFAYVTSHDLKAPLRAIANLSQWIEEDIGDSFTDDTRQQMDLLRRRVHRMEALINGILQYSRIGRVSVDVENVDVASLLGEVIESLAPPAGFTVEINANMPILKTTYTRLSQVFSNLISNAIKYSDKSNGRVKISMQEVRDYYEFSVADNGPGIDPKFHDKIFVIFQTLQARDTFESTGVGLTLVKKIVEEQGGEIRLESVPEKGATFYFTWPKQPKEL